jgi:hypothetical protein
MRILIFFLLIVLCSCSDAVDKPKNLLPEKEMSTLIAEFAIVSQLSFVAPNVSQENETRYVLKKHKIKAKDFKDSYTYYAGVNKLDKIFSDAQTVILEKDPKAKSFIENKLKDKKLLPVTGR